MSAVIIVNPEVLNRMWGEFVQLVLEGAIEHWAGEVNRNAAGDIVLDSYLDLPRTVITNADFAAVVAKQRGDRTPTKATWRHALWDVLNGAIMQPDMADIIAQYVVVGGPVFHD